jgi:hypothetical protein
MDRMARMRKSSHGLGLAPEARERDGIVRQLRGKDLDRNVAIESEVPGAVDLAHAAGAEGRDDLVGAESRTCSQRHGGPMVLP